MAKKVMYAARLDGYLVECLRRSAFELGETQAGWLEAAIVARVREEPWFRAVEAGRNRALARNLEERERIGDSREVASPEREYDPRLDPTRRPELRK